MPVLSSSEFPQEDMGYDIPTMVNMISTGNMKSVVRRLMTPQSAIGFVTILMS